MLHGFIIVGVDGKPMFLEVNFGGSTSFYQLATRQSIFGDLTEEVLAHVKNELENKEPVLMYRHRRKIAEEKLKGKKKNYPEIRR